MLADGTAVDMHSLVVRSSRFCVRALRKHKTKPFICGQLGLAFGAASWLGMSLRRLDVPARGCCQTRGRRRLHR